MKPKKRLPKFKSEAEERRFWATHDSTECLDWSKAKRVLFPTLKPSVKPASLRGFLKGMKVGEIREKRDRL